MRIITGTAKGQKIETPKKEIRPAQSIVRHAVFSMLHGLFEGAYVLDLFAGSGSYGLEALSRGAQKAFFVDIDKRCVRTVQKNLKNTNLKSRGEVFKMDAMDFVEKYQNAEIPTDHNIAKEPKLPKFDLIFLSPPYETGAQIHLIKNLSLILNHQGVIIFDHAKETELPEKINNLEKIRSRTFGATTISIYSTLQA